MFCKMAVTSTLRNRFQSFWTQIKADVPLSFAVFSDMVLLYPIAAKIDEYYQGLIKFGDSYHQTC